MNVEEVDEAAKVETVFFFSASLDFTMLFRPCPCGNSSQIPNCFCEVATIWDDSNHFVRAASLCNVDQSSLRLTRLHQCLFNDLISKNTTPEKLIISEYGERTLFHPNN